MRCIVAETDKIGECPTWDERQRRFWWIDVVSKSIASCDPDGGDVRRRSLEDHPGSFGLRRSEGLVIAFRRGIALFDGAGRKVSAVPLVPEIVNSERFNDGACDSRGRFWVGTMDRRMQEPIGGLYRIDPDLSIHRMTDGICLSNGVAWSPDETRLYHCDSTPPRVYVHDFDAESGTVSNRRVLVTFDFATMGKADGCAVDAEGFLWVAAPRTGYILRFDPDGRLERKLATPTLYPSSIAFGGADLRTLYITSMQPHGLDPAPQDGAVFATEMETPGLGTPRFAG